MEIKLSFKTQEEICTTHENAYALMDELKEVTCSSDFLQVTEDVAFDNVARSSIFYDVTSGIVEARRIDTNELVGYAHIRAGNELTEIAYIATKHKKIGIASAIINYVENNLIGLDAKVIIASVNERNITAQQHITKQGFKFKKRMEYDDDAVVEFGYEKQIGKGVKRKDFCCRDNRLTLAEVFFAILRH